MIIDVHKHVDTQTVYSVVRMGMCRQSIHVYLTKHLTWNEREDLGALGEHVYVSMSRGDSLGTKAQSHICAPFPGKKRGQPKLRAP